MLKNVQLIFLLAESALELVPSSLTRHPQILHAAKLLRKNPENMLLDSTYHYKAILESNLKFKHKRGRPDIIHRALLLIRDSLLSKYGLVDIYVHTIEDKIIVLCRDIRLPRNYIRFIGLMEKLFKDRVIMSNETSRKKKILMKIVKMSVNDFVKNINPSYILAFSRKGDLTPQLKDLLKNILDDLRTKANTVRILNIIGGFPHGHFSHNIYAMADKIVSLSKESLSTQYVICRIISAYEEILLS